MPDGRARALNLPLGERTGDTDFQRRTRLPLLLQFSRRDAEGAGHGLETGDEDAIC